MNQLLQLPDEQNNLNDVPGQDDDGNEGGDELLTEFGEFMMDDDTKDFCNSSVSDVVAYCGTAGYDFAGNLSAYPYSSQNVNATYSLFVSALGSAQSTSDVINIVNNYISIIEADNEFTSEEKEILYGGMVVSVYSFNLWYVRLLSELGIYS
ncbi:MAG: hypothetical protein IJ604_11285 [Prevotella sp.]|nr:hypothetical protein [Prevotella sp.]